MVNALIISILNVFLVFTYAVTFGLPLTQIPTSLNECPALSFCFLPDIIQYREVLEKIDIQLIIDHFLKLNGGVATHMIIYAFFPSTALLSASILINSIFVGFSVSIAGATSSLARQLGGYLILSPVFIYFSYGPTKEILFLAAMVFIFISHNQILRLLGYGFTVLVKPIYLLAIALVKMRISLAVSIFLSTIGISLVMPFLSEQLGIAYLQPMPQKLSQEIDSLRFLYAGFGLLGWLSSFFKSVLEPIIYVSRFGFGNLLIDVYLWSEVLLIGSLLRMLKKNKRSDIIFHSVAFLTLVFILVAWYPLVQYRYALVPVCLFILINFFYEKSTCSLSSPILQK